MSVVATRVGPRAKRAEFYALAVEAQSAEIGTAVTRSANGNARGAVWNRIPASNVAASRSRGPTRCRASLVMGAPVALNSMPTKHALSQDGGAIITDAAISTELIVSPLDARKL